MNLNDYPVVALAGSDEWRGYWEWGTEMDALFPKQDAIDFALACGYNDYGPVSKTADGPHVCGLLMVQQGECDERDWVWLVALTNGTHHVATGGCDYTGWDCRSWIDWAVFP